MGNNSLFKVTMTCQKYDAEPSVTKSVHVEAEDEENARISSAGIFDSMGFGDGIISVDIEKASDEETEDWISMKKHYGIA